MKMNALGRAPTTSFRENAVGTRLAPFYIPCMFVEISFFFRCEETLTQNLRSLTGKYQDLEDSYSE